MALRGIRGATVADANSKEAIASATEELLTALIEHNQIQEATIATIFFSVTPDLDAEFPAVAARKMGFQDTPLLCLTEIPVPNSLGKCIRILIHLNTKKNQTDMRHVYLKEAITLRPDSCQKT